MPYIKREKRPGLELIIRSMMEKVKVDGDLSYILFAFCKRLIGPITKENDDGDLIVNKEGYNNYKNFCGELRQCATEIERRLLGPYEDKKCQENGDVI